jgi:hypothetical protein
MIVIGRTTAFSVHMGSLGDLIWTENAVDSLFAHVLVGEPDSTSPEHALSGKQICTKA